MDRWLLPALLLTLAVRESRGQSGLEPPQPQGVSVEPDFASDVLSISWEKDLSPPILFYDIEVLRTELMETVYNGTVEVRPDSAARVHHWNWSSPVPLQCTSHSVRVRSRQQEQTSEWSPLQTVLGMDIPDSTETKMFPQDRVVAVGNNMTFCCIVEEKRGFSGILYQMQHMNATRLSRRSYATTLTNQPASMPSGTNVICTNDNSVISGAVVFVGYPPGDQDLVCETRDLESVVCHWSKGRDTSLRGPRRTFYTLNGRNCSSANQLKKAKQECILSKTEMDHGERNWTLVAKNPLGTIQLTDIADPSDRVWPMAPRDLSTSEVHTRNASVRWNWGPKGYKTLPLLCQVQLRRSGHADTWNYSGSGLSQAVLEDLEPDEMYVVRVRCGSQNFWKWGDWSSDYSFRTKEDRPDALNIWIRMDGHQTGYVLWKPLSKSLSHGQIKSYEVTYRSLTEEGPKITSLTVPHQQYSAPFRLEDNSTDHIITVTASNSAGASLPADIIIPRFLEDEAYAPREELSRDGGFDLSWNASANSSCGYVVDWCPTSSGQNSSLDWVKVPSGNSVRIQSNNFVAGVRYTISIYSCTSGAPELLERREGYTEEMAPAQRESGLKAQQIMSDVVLSWNRIPLESQRGFLRGYIVYMSNSSHLVPIANITNPEVRSHTVRNLAPNTYKFTVKAYTSAGEDGGNTITIKVESLPDWLIVEILAALGVMTAFLLLMTVLCYKKRTWVKKTFYPEIPEPKLPEEWPTTQGTIGSRTLDVVPCPHNPVHIEERPERDWGKPGLGVTVEEDEDAAESGDEGSIDTYSSGLVALRYYNQMVGEGSLGLPSADNSSSSSSSSTSSMGSTRTEVTYTGIQSFGTSSGAAAQPEAPPTGGYRPQVDPAPGPAAPEAAPAESGNLPLLGNFGGYQPQCSWRLDSPEAASLNSSLGSPTSVNSSQFLLPDPASEEGGERAPATTWLHSLLSGKP